MILAAPPTNALTQQPLENKQVEELAKLVETLVALEAEVQMREQQIEQTKEKLKNIQFGILPEVMNSLGVRSLVLTNGEQLIVKKVYSCSVSDENRDLKAAAMAWLRQNSLADIIKSEIKVPLPKGNDKLTKKIRSFLEKNGVLFGQSEQVANPTIKSLMKERIENGQAFPLDIFRGFVGNKAEVIRPD